MNMNNRLFQAMALLAQVLEDTNFQVADVRAVPSQGGVGLEVQLYITDAQLQLVSPVIRQVGKVTGVPVEATRKATGGLQTSEVPDVLLGTENRQNGFSDPQEGPGMDTVYQQVHGVLAGKEVPFEEVQAWNKQQGEGALQEMGMSSEQFQTGLQAAVQALVTGDETKLNEVLDSFDLEEAIAIQPEATPVMVDQPDKPKLVRKPKITPGVDERVKEALTKEPVPVQAERQIGAGPVHVSDEMLKRIAEMVYSREQGE